MLRNSKATKATKKTPLVSSKTASRPGGHRHSLQAQQLLTRTAHDIVVTQVQSNELVRSVIAATLSGVCYTRGIFPANAFEARTWEFANPDVSYDSFMSGANGFIVGGSQEQPIANWMVFAPGRDRGVDKILGWMDNGIADALEKKYLAGIQLSFYDGQEIVANKLTEAYMLSVTYENGTPTLQMSKRTKTGSQSVDEAVILADAKKDIQRLVNTAITRASQWDEVIPESPAEQIMNMFVTYTKSCPPDYSAPGFHKNPDQDLVLNDKPSALPTIDTGYHTVSAKLFNKRIQFLRRDETTPRHAVQRAVTNAPSSQIAGTQVDALQNFDKSATSHSRGLREPALDTQPFHLHNHGSHSFGDLCYTQAVLARIDNAREEVSPLDEVPATTKCECDASDHSDTLGHPTGVLLCAICLTYKHGVCYGYLDSIPHLDDFVCYTCLLESEQALFSEIPRTCISRRAVEYLQRTQGLTNMEALANHLNITPKAVEKRLGTLKKEGIIKMTPKISLKGKEKAGDVRVTIDSDKLRDLFDPYLHIRHHYVVPDESQVASEPQLPQTPRPTPKEPAPALSIRDGKRAASGMESGRKRIRNESGTPFGLGRI